MILSSAATESGTWNVLTFNAANVSPTLSPGDNHDNAAYLDVKSFPKRTWNGAVTHPLPSSLISDALDAVELTEPLTDDLPENMPVAFSIVLPISDPADFINELNRLILYSYLTFSQIMTSSVLYEEKDPFLPAKERNGPYQSFISFIF